MLAQTQGLFIIHQHEAKHHLDTQQQEFLKARGFSVKADLAGEETAFIAEWGSGKPILAFLGE